jgi:hypothetical protein
MAVSKSSLLPGETGVNAEPGEIAGQDRGKSGCGAPLPDNLSRELDCGARGEIAWAIDRVQVGAVGFAKDGRRKRRNGKFY